VRVLRGIVALAYPLLVHGGLLRFGPRVVAAAGAVVLVAHAGPRWRRWRRSDVVRAAVPAGLVAAVLRVLTWLWCGFVAVKITISLRLALGSTLAAWTLDNGLLAHVHDEPAAPVDPLFRWLFPPPATGGGR
jgi:uncharacterized membrane protein